MIQIRVLLSIFFISLSITCNNYLPKTNTQYVDPLIGIAGSGHTFPGATTPFGLVQLSPDMSIDRWEFCSGYNTQASSIIGFSHTHLNGTGVGDLGDILLMPTIGALIFKKGSESMPETGYRSHINFQTEKASPGYYSVELEKYHIKAELTATPRVGFQKYTFPSTDSLNLILDLASNIAFHDIRHSQLELLDNQTIIGHKIVNSWPGIRNVYFAMKLSQPIQAFILQDKWQEQDIKRKTTNAIQTNNIIIDGQLDEKVWNLNHSINKLVSGETDNKGVFNTAWDPQNLYVGIQVTDNALVLDSNNPWDDDGVEIYIDGNNSKSTQYDKYDRQIAIAAGKDNVREVKGNPLKLNYKKTITNDGYILEIAISWKNLGINPKPGNCFGLDISINDDDDKGTREGKLLWAGDDNNWISTEYFGEIKLLDQEGNYPVKENKTQKMDIQSFAIESYPKTIKMNKGIVSSFKINSEKETELLVKVGLSTTSTAAALQAIENEIPNWDFNHIINQSKTLWDDELQRIQIEAPEPIKKTFYTALYHAMLQPNLISDKDGKFTTPNGTIKTGPNGKFYSTFSLWDTYRAWHPLMTIIDTTRVSDMINSLIYSYDLLGALPRWTLWGGETHCMIGNHAIPVIVDAYFKGIKGFDIKRAYETIKASTNTINPLSNWPVYNKYGYLPYDIERTESVSKTLEMAFDDWCIAQMAKNLGKEEDYQYFIDRSNFYKNLFDSETGFMRGKDSYGKWIPDFNPLEVGHSSQGYGCYTEGNAWQHSWYVPQDVEGLIKSMGGKTKFSQKLDSLFLNTEDLQGDVVSDVSGLIGQYAHGNEPSHHVAYLYNYADQAWKTQKMVRKILSEQYNTSHNGLCGNDDCGQMSAWYILSAMGFYPVNPANGIYDIGSPCIEHASINVKNGKQFVIKVNNQSNKNIYIKSISLNGSPLKHPYITHQEIMQGGKLIFVMDNQPNQNLYK